ncbi:hypothetical protein ACFQZE_24500, partial [Paenibacillus sp. GCM10027627]|uniref:hypothetical protein n=1 Tax=unclassified Paenibacillus TaxID=185978 RepID=UPI00363A4428
MPELFRSAFTKADLIGAATVPIVLGQYNKIGEYKVQAGETITIGYGLLSGMDNAIGRIYAIIKDSNVGGVELKGKLRLSIYSPQDRPLKIMHEWRTEALNTSATDRTKQTPLPEGIEVITEDKKIVLEFLPDAV